MFRFFTCSALFLLQFSYAQTFSEAHLKHVREVQQACRTKTNSIDRSVCQSNYRLKLVETKCGRNAEGLVDGSIVAGEVKCGISSTKPSPKPVKKDSKKVTKKVTKTVTKKDNCKYATSYACDAYEFRMRRCLQSSDDKKFCQETSHQFALKAQVHEQLGDEGIKVYDNCLNMKDSSPDECVKFAKFYMDEAKKKRDIAANNECSDFAVGDQNVNCHGYEYKRVDSDLGDISRKIESKVRQDPAAIRHEFLGGPSGARGK